MKLLAETSSLGTPHPTPSAEDQRPWLVDPWCPVLPIPTGEPPPPGRTALRLTHRELEVAAWLGEDITCDGMARRLGISRETVRAHLRNMARKLGVRSRHALVARLAIAGIRITQKGG